MREQADYDVIIVGGGAQAWLLRSTPPMKAQALR